MSDYQKVELKKAGDTLLLTVEHVFFNPTTATHRYPDFTFKGQSPQGPAMLYIPEDACRRQFSRMTMEPENAQGLTIRVSRAPNTQDSTKPYWNIEAADPGRPKAATPATPAPPSKRVQCPVPPVSGAEPADDFGADLPPDPGGILDDEAAAAFAGAEAGSVVAIGRIVRLYFWLYARVRAEQARLAGLQDADGMPFDAASVNAETFSIWNTLDKRGLLR